MGPRIERYHYKENADVRVRRDADVVAVARGVRIALFSFKLQASSIPVNHNSNTTHCFYPGLGHFINEKRRTSALK